MDDDLSLFLAKFEDGDGFHAVVLHASDEEDATYCIQEGWEEAEGIQVSPVTLFPEQFADLQVGCMRELQD